MPEEACLGCKARDEGNDALVEHQIINVRVIVDRVSHSGLSKLKQSQALLKIVKKSEMKG